MRFYNHQHPFYCGVDLHARSMHVCLVDAAGNTLVHKNIEARPERFLNLIGPYRAGLAVAAECMFAWYWLADLCQAANINRVGVAEQLADDSAQRMIASDLAVIDAARVQRTSTSGVAIACRSSTARSLKSCLVRCAAPSRGELQPVLRNSPSRIASRFLKSRFLSRNMGK